MSVVIIKTDDDDDDDDDGLSRTVSEINGDIRRKSNENRQSPPPRVLNVPDEWVPLGIVYQQGVSRNYNDGAFRWLKRFSDRFSSFDTIPECDGQPASHPA